jgi:hypothetical protein
MIMKKNNYLLSFGMERASGRSIPNDLMERPLLWFVT